jgi:hypothetical protein
MKKELHSSDPNKLQSMASSNRRGKDINATVGKFGELLDDDIAPETAPIYRLATHYSGMRSINRVNGSLWQIFRLF